MVFSTSLLSAVHPCAHFTSWQVPVKGQYL